MCGAKWIEFALAAFGETIEPTRLPQTTNTLPSARQNLMWVGLMADIPNEAVMRRIKNIMQRNCKFDHTKTCSKMATCYGNRVNRFQT